MDVVAYLEVGVGVDVDVGEGVAHFVGVVTITKDMRAEGVIFTS